MDPKNFPSRKAGQVVHTPQGVWAFAPAPLPPEIDWTETLIGSLATAERQLGRLAAAAGSFPIPGLLLTPFVRSEAVLSSRIEGTRASLVDLYAYEASQGSFFEPKDDVREVHNYVRAMAYGLERLQDLPLSLRFIRELHAILMEGVGGAALYPGEFRRSQNWIGPAGSTPSSAPYVPPPVEEMQRALADLEQFLHAGSGLPALVRISLVHYQFEAIHPFLDGNGRVGRLLSILLLCYWNVLPQPLINLSAYIERHRQEYYDKLLQVSQAGAWEAWLAFMLGGFAGQAGEAIDRLEQLQALRQSYQALVAPSRNPQRMAALIDFLFSRPVLTIRQAAEALHIPPKTAQDYLAKLSAAGVVAEVTGYKRNRLFQAGEILRRLP